MNTKGIIGRKIVAVQQYRLYDRDLRQTQVAIAAIVLDNGTEISFVTGELPGDYYTVAVARRPPKPPKPGAAS